MYMSLVVYRNDSNGIATTTTTNTKTSTPAATAADSKNSNSLGIVIRLLRKSLLQYASL